MINAPNPLADPREEADRQRLRLQRTCYGLVGGVLMFLVFGLLYLQGHTRLDIREFGLLALVYWSGSLTFPVLILTGLNLRLREPSMTLAMILFATTMTFTMVFFTVEGRHLLLLAYLPAMMFGTFQLGVGQFVIVTVYALVLYGACVIHFQAMFPGHTRLSEELVNWLVFFVVMGGFTLLGSESSRVRRRLRRRNYELREARDAATLANQAKSRFLAATSDELRTPLNVILGVADVVNAETMDSEQRDALTRAHHAGAYLLAMVNSMIDQAKLESGALELRRQAFDLSQEMRDLEAMVRPLMQDQGLTFHLALDPALPERVQGDAVRLREVLVHLITCAEKFTDHGDVRLTVATAAPDEPQRIRFAVGDSGGEHPRDRIPGRLGNSMSDVDEMTGSGMGLALCEQLIERMESRLETDHAQSQGSRFCFGVQLPAVSPALRKRDPAPPLPPAHTLPARVLLVDDAEENRMLIRAFLRDHVAHVDEAEDGIEGLERFRDGAYDVILMDMHMPRMDGIEATRAMRETERERGDQRSVILALTADDSVHDRLRSLEAGCDDHLVKPISKRALLSALSMWQTLRRQPDAPVSPAGSAGGARSA